MRKCRLLLLLLVFVLIYVIFGPSKNFTHDIELCPACYGNNLCYPITHNQIQLTSYSNWKVLNWLLNLKNVYYITFNEEDYVMKKLAHDRELVEFNEVLCLTAFFTKSCTLSQAWQSISKRNELNIEKIIHKSDKLFAETEVIKCKHQNVLNYLWENHKKYDTDTDSLAHFLTMLAVNPEPLIMQSFKQIQFFPRHIGSCGRLIIESYEGLTLTNYYNSEWELRVSLAIQLLEIAKVLSENPIRMYLTDVSSDNFAVNSKGKVKLIDLESIVLVDSAEPGLVNASHMNEGLGCSDCLSFTFESLCNHKYSDHNYFAICKGLLSSSAFSPSMSHGLLHNIPAKIQSNYPYLRNLIEQCAHPSTNIRPERASTLLMALHNIL